MEEQAGGEQKEETGESGRRRRGESLVPAQPVESAQRTDHGAGEGQESERPRLRRQSSYQVVRLTSAVPSMNTAPQIPCVLLVIVGELSRSDPEYRMVCVDAEGR